ncbi:MAG TPA: cytidylate kinase-like family protein, partial [Anaerolineales bacterium]|nr:cytidylate kinase-like family protein [Anaerolineales bacterium]
TPTGAELRSWRQDISGARVQEIERLDHEQVLALIQSVILSVYNRDNFMIVGRGGQAILQDRHGVLHVRIEAPVEMRIQRVMALQNLDEAEAAALVKQRDRAALEYLQRFYNINPSDSSLYHLILNTDHLKSRTAVDVICTAIAQAEPVGV